ncbi:MAG: glycosyltransferase family 39 protein [Actinobacteria bacterium]|nr:glycosyltransferase family 39 protein [Actinomycetota bacterium]
MRALPLALPWVAALVVTAPAAPRHELASSAGAQALALLLAAYAVGAAVTLWRAETLRPELGYVGALQAQAARVAPWLAIASLLGAGVLQAASYIAITVDDLARYWSVADSLSHGLGYDVWAGGGGTAQAGAGEQWMDPPALPAFQAVTFAVLGHTLPAALAPMFVANSALPALAYLAARALGVGYGVAYAAGLLTAVTPPIQIYSLGAAEPDPIFAAGLALVGALFAQVLRSRRPRVLWLAFGAAAGLVALTRPEGPLYATLLLAAAAAAQRSRWTVAGLVTAGVLVAPFMGLSQALVGRPWPQQPQGLSFGNLATNLGIGFDQVWPRTGRLLLLDDARFSVLGGALALSFVGGAAALVRRRWALGALPLAALLNLGITLGIDPGALRTTETSELIRHVAPAFPAIVLVGAVGVDVLGRAAAQWAVRRRWRVVPGRLTVGLGVVAGTYLAAGSLYLLATPEEFHHGGGNGALLRADIYVNAPELWRDPYPLPCPPCAGPTWDFNDFRFQLFARFRPLDVHSGSDGAAYQTLTGALAALGFAASLGRGVTPAAPLSGRAVRSAAPGAPDAA